MTTKPRNLGTESQLFVDDKLIAAKENVQRSLHPCRKLPQPVLVPDKPWEGNRVYAGTVHRDPYTGEFKLWYMSYSYLLGQPEDREKGRDPKLRGRFGYRLRAESPDGVHWRKPDLSRYLHDGSKRNNIVFDYGSVYVEPPGSDEENPYKLLGSLSPIADSNERSGYWAAVSPNGLDWRDVAQAPVIPGADTITLTRNPQNGEYLAFHKQYLTIGGHRRRTVWLSTSTDFLNWTTPRLIFAPDEQDDAWTEGKDERTEFYNMTAFPYGGQWLGLITTFRVTEEFVQTEENRLLRSPVDGPIYGELTHSRDGYTWNRFEDRSPIIPNGPHDWDAGTILSTSKPIVVGDEVWVYYTGINTTHGGSLPEKRAVIGRAAWRLDGFVSIDAGSSGGYLETPLLALSGTQLILNADASKGRLTVEILDAAGNPIAGYGRADCRIMTTNETRHPVSWKKQNLLDQGRLARVRFYLQNACLFSFRFC